jgi:hypothetical protein
MSTYAITFRIKNATVNGLTYDERRAALVENARAEELGYWDETTSFILVESNKATDIIAKRVVAGLSPKHDMLVIFDPADMSCCYFGAINYEEVLLSFFPKARKLG